MLNDLLNIIRSVWNVIYNLLKNNCNCCGSINDCIEETINEVKEIEIKTKNN